MKEDQVYITTVIPRAHPEWNLDKYQKTGSDLLQVYKKQLLDISDQSRIEIKLNHFLKILT